jgi:hypothetical protein
MDNVNFIKTICAWCGIDIGINPSAIGSSCGVSHGICKDCFSVNIESLTQKEYSWQGFARSSSGCRSLVDTCSVSCRR